MVNVEPLTYDGHEYKRWWIVGYGAASKGDLERTIIEYFEHLKAKEKEEKAKIGGEKKDE